MTLQEKWLEIDSVRGIELIEKLSKLTEIEGKYVAVKSNLRVAEWHYEWMEKSNFYKDAKIAHVKKQKQFEKIMKYKKIIEELESKQNLATC